MCHAPSAEMYKYRAVQQLIHFLIKVSYLMFVKLMYLVYLRWFIPLTKNRITNRLSLDFTFTWIYMVLLHTLMAYFINTS